MIFLQQTLNGLVLGHAYALIAIGWTMLLGVARLVNFSHGQMYMIAAFVTWYFIARQGMSYLFAAAIAILAGIGIGLIVQRILMRLCLRQDLVSIMIATLGCGYALHGIAGLVFGSTGQILETPLSRRDIYWGDLWLTWQDIAIVIAAILFFVALKYIIEKTHIGRTIRMVAEDPQLAALSGVNVRAIYLAVFALEGAAVALAAVLVAPRAPILTSMGFEEAIATFVVVVLGGIGSVAGSYFAALALGLFTALFGAYISPAYANAATFVALTAILAIRPGGFATTHGMR